MIFIKKILLTRCITKHYNQNPNIIYASPSFEGGRGEELDERVGGTPQHRGQHNQQYTQHIHPWSSRG